MSETEEEIQPDPETVQTMEQYLRFDMDPEQFARFLYETYNRIAPDFDQPVRLKGWDDLPVAERMLWIEVSFRGLERLGRGS